MKRQQPGFWPLYPFVVAALPVVHFYLGNFRMLEPGDGARILVAYLGLTALALALGRMVWGQTHRAALVVTPVLLVFFKGDALGPAACLALLAAAIFAGFWLKRKTISARAITLPLNMAALVFLALPLARIGWAEIRNSAPVALRHPAEEAPQLHWNTDQGPPPDVYYLLIDGLGQPEQLAREYPLTDQVLRQALSRRGFQVLERSRSSYGQTALSVASTLNLDHLQNLLQIPDPSNSDRRILGTMIGNSLAVSALRQVGYQVASFPSGYPITRLKAPDHRWQPKLNPSFVEYYVLDDGLLPLLLKGLGRGPSGLSHALRRHRLEFIWDQLPAARAGLDDSQPLFVFAHILAPHPPFVFDRSGKPTNPPVKFGFADGSHWRDAHGADAQQYKAQYSDQFAYVMRRLGEAVDGILAHSPRPPVIIIQGDHGPGAALDWENAATSDHQERFGIFNAWLLPPDIAASLAEDETAVNTFGILFERVFAAEWESRPSRQWFSTSSQPYEFSAVGP